MALETTGWVGQTVAGGRYDVTAKLGEGGMGFVYRARDANLECDVVIKVPRREMIEDAHFASRFRREVRSLVRLAHPGVVKVLDVGEHDGVPYAVLQYLPGGNLRDLHEEAEQLPLAQRLAGLSGWLPGIAAALDFIHAQGYVHRDVKPENILFDAARNPYLGDFGIAKVLADARPEAERTVQTLTGMILGTPRYMAPELALGQPFDGRADQYALAVAVYEQVAGRPPFDGQTAAAVLVQQATQTPQPLDAAVPGVPASLAAAVQRALAKDPGERFPDCSTFARAVLEAAGGRPASEPAVPAPAPPGPPLAPTTVATAGDTREDVTAEPVPETVQCPVCHKRYRLPPERRGKRVRCPACTTTFTPAVPPEAAAAPPAAPAPASAPPDAAPRRVLSPQRLMLLGAAGVVLALVGVGVWLGRDAGEEVSSVRAEVSPAGGVSAVPAPEGNGEAPQPAPPEPAAAPVVEEWIEAPQPVVRGDMRITVDAVRVMDGQLQITLAVENANGRSYTTGMYPSLVDATGWEIPYAGAVWSKGPGTLLSGPALDTFLFHVPAQPVESLRLELPGVQGTPPLRFRIAGRLLALVNARQRGPDGAGEAQRALTDANPRIRAGAAAALGELGPVAAPAVPALAERLHRDDQAEVRRAAAQALARVGTAGRTAFKPLLQGLEDQDPGVLRAVEDGLRQCTPTRTDVPALRDTLRSPSARARQFAANALDGLGPAAASALPDLQGALRDSSPDVRGAAAAAIGAIGADAAGAVADLAQLRTDRDRGVRRSAVRALGQLATVPGAADALLASLGDDDEETVQAAANSLKGVSFTREQVPALVSALRSPKAPARTFAVAALGQLGREAKVAVPALVKQLDDRDPNIVEQAATTLGKMGPAAWEAAAPLARLLQAKDHAVRRSAALALKELGPSAARVVPDLVRAAGDPGIRYLVASAIRAMGKAAVPSLVQVAQKGPQPERVQAIRLLGELGSDAAEALPLLQARSRDSAEMPALRRAAEEALRSIQGKP